MTSKLYKSLSKSNSNSLKLNKKNKSLSPNFKFNKPSSINNYTIEDLNYDNALDKPKIQRNKILDDYDLSDINKFFNRIETNPDKRFRKLKQKDNQSNSQFSSHFVSNYSPRYSSSSSSSYSSSYSSSSSSSSTNEYKLYQFLNDNTKKYIKQHFFLPDDRLNLFKSSKSSPLFDSKKYTPSNLSKTIQDKNISNLFASKKFIPSHLLKSNSSIKDTFNNNNFYIKLYNNLLIIFDFFLNNSNFRDKYDDFNNMKKTFILSFNRYNNKIININNLLSFFNRLIELLFRFYKNHFFYIINNKNFYLDSFYNIIYCINVIYVYILNYLIYNLYIYNNITGNSIDLVFNFNNIPTLNNIDILKVRIFFSNSYVYNFNLSLIFKHQHHQIPFNDTYFYFQCIFHSVLFHRKLSEPIIKSIIENIVNPHHLNIGGF